MSISQHDKKTLLLKIGRISSFKKRLITVIEQNNAKDTLNIPEKKISS